MWSYQQSTGELRHDGALKGVGYSGHAHGHLCPKLPAGHGEGKNNPAMQSVHQVGPIPRGRYTIGAPHDSDTHGPYVMALTPDPATEMFGRDCFLMHGDSQTNPGGSSMGCIVMARLVRMQVGNSGDTALEVIE